MVFTGKTLWEKKFAISDSMVDSVTLKKILVILFVIFEEADGKILFSFIVDYHV